jgi:uncharacterized membrane protein YkvA (DUF1232 family)
VDADIGRRFVDTMRGWLISLPHDLKILYEASSDANLDRASRELATGAILYVVSPSDYISADRSDFSGYADDCLILRLALSRIVAKKDEDSQQFLERFGDFFASLAEELAVCKKAMGELYGWLDSLVDGLPRLEYKGKKVSVYLDDDEASEMLYEDGLAFATDYPVDEDDIADRFKKASTIIDVIQKKKVDEDRKRAG